MQYDITFLVMLYCKAKRNFSRLSLTYSSIFFKSREFSLAGSRMGSRRDSESMKYSMLFLVWGWRRPYEKGRGGPLGAERGPSWWPARKQGPPSHNCQQPSLTTTTWVGRPWTPDENVARLTPGFQPWRNLSRDSSPTRPDFWLTQAVS